VLCSSFFFFSFLSPPGAPFEGNIEALLFILEKLETVHIDVTKYDRILNRAVADVDQLVALNAVYPSLLYPSFKLQAGELFLKMIVF